MILKMFSILDIKSDTFSPPFCAPTIGVAARNFKELVNDPNSLPGKYPGDFKLVELGTFDDVTGVLIAEQGTSHGFGTDYIDRKSVPPPNLSVARDA